MKPNFYCYYLLVAWQILPTLCALSQNDPRQKEESILCKMGCHCPPYTEYTSMMCDHSNMAVLPTSIRIPQQVTVLSLKENGISNISKSTFTKAPNLEELDLSQNHLYLIENHSLKGFPGLLVLHLSHNKFTEVRAGLLEGLQSLQMLQMGHNYLKELPDDLFAPTPGLRELHLQSNYLVNLKEHSFRHLALLDKLDLQNNGLSTLNPFLFQHTSRLQWLTLSGNNFQRVPKEAFRYTRMLSSLDLSGNAFPSLKAESFSTLYNLSYLYLNELGSLKTIEKDAFKNMSELKLLSCSYNSKLYYIHPQAFGVNSTSSNYRMTPTEKLYLAHNALRTLPEPMELNSWMTMATVDLMENPWRCDCHLRWMVRLRKDIAGTASCETPWWHHGRSIDSMKEEEFVCSDRWAFSTMFIMACSLAAFSVCCAFGSALLCYKTPFGEHMRAKWQFSYAKVNRKNEVVDLEWDPSADL